MPELKPHIIKDNAFNWQKHIKSTFQLAILTPPFHDPTGLMPLDEYGNSSIPIQSYKKELRDLIHDLAQQMIPGAWIFLQEPAGGNTQLSSLVPFLVIDCGPYKDISDLGLFSIPAIEEDNHPYPTILDSQTRYVIHHFSRPGDIILELFAGTAPFSKAAMQLNRSYVAIDIRTGTNQPQKTPFRYILE